VAGLTASALVRVAAVVVVVAGAAIPLVASHPVANFFLLAVAFVFAHSTFVLAAIPFVVPFVGPAALLPPVLPVIAIGKQH
jgi:hypothetical protein